jgi:putative Mn2+ efflux pump MntP
VLALFLVAVSLGLSNFAAAIGIGIAGVDTRTRLRVGVVFGIFEAGMPVLGLVIGRGLASDLGHAARWAGGGLLIATGGYALLQSRATQRDLAIIGAGPARLAVTGLALSIDNLAVGFALGTYRVSLAVAAGVIGGVSVALSLAGLELGARLGARLGQHGEIASGLILIGVGAAIAAGLL